MVDLVTNYQVVGPVDSKHPAAVWTRLLEQWVFWAGPPQRLISDIGEEFRRECSMELESTCLSDPQKVRWVCCVANWAVNSQVDESGYSPSQWVLGRGIRLPYNLQSQTGRLSSRARRTQDRSFAERLAALAAAQRPIIALRHSRALRGRGATAPFRPRPDLAWGTKCSTGEGTASRRPHGLIPGMVLALSSGLRAITCRFSAAG